MVALAFGVRGRQPTTRERFAQFLNQSGQGLNNTSTTGGIAHALNQGIIGALLGSDRGELLAAQQAATQGANPPPLPPNIQGPLPQGGLPGAVAALQGLPGNEQAGRLATRLALSQAGQEDAQKRRLQLKAAPGFVKPALASGTAPARNFLFRQQLVKKHGENSPQVRRFDSFVRAPQFLNLGNQFTQADPSRPGQAAGTFPVGVAPKTSIDTKNNRVIVAPPVPGGQPGGGAQAGPTTTDIRPPKAQQTKARSALQGFERQTKVVVNTIDEALRLIGPFSTGFGAFLADMPETDAGKLRNALDTIKANVGFDKLQQMRDNSPTGGALGQVSELENRLLQAVSGALDPRQSQQLEQNLNNIKDLYGKVMEERRAAFKADFGGDGSAPRTQQVTQPTQRHIQGLIDNPDQASEFDARFGTGAAARILGQ